MIAYLINNNGSFSVQRAKGFKPKNAVAVVPDSFAKDDYPFLTGQEVYDEVLEANVWQVVLDDTAKGDALSEESKESQKVSLRASYIADIDAEMMRIFGTVDRDKANALYNTWYEWLKDPSYFADKGLLDDEGLAMDTSGKIYSFAQTKVNLCKDYSVFLIQREKQYRDAVAAL